ncbi:LPS assembly lipoprotein LptE [Jannaschia sp. CCS1]|uniref:LPS assembly lipoprotein LptE n=1 Tax=Jannaschia sp. (strain CCS1) TaxID=290400 RepID=UPI000053C3D1|nr:LPS assembly lipoprotein LptE [Jannaschia sp. CCS1]ABD53327.1 lipoprotein putative [Jannaschia sp. CCS1]
MSLFRRRTLLVLLSALPLAACNFQPVYGPGGSGDIIRDQIRVAEPNSRLEFELVSRLEDRLGAGSSYALNYSVSVATRNLAIDETAVINRVNLVGNLNFNVTEVGTGRNVQTATVSTFTSYATTESPVATESARRDAEDRLAVALADQMVTRLIAGAQSW